MDTMETDNELTSPEELGFAGKSSEDIIAEYKEKAESPKPDEVEETEAEPLDEEDEEEEVVEETAEETPPPRDLEAERKEWESKGKELGLIEDDDKELAFVKVPSFTEIWYEEKVKEEKKLLEAAQLLEDDPDSMTEQEWESRQNLIKLASDTAFQRAQERQGLEMAAAFERSSSKNTMGKIHGEIASLYGADFQQKLGLDAATYAKTLEIVSKISDKYAKQEAKKELERKKKAMDEQKLEGKKESKKTMSVESGKSMAKTTSPPVSKAEARMAARFGMTAAEFRKYGNMKGGK